MFSYNTLSIINNINFTVSPSNNFGIFDFSEKHIL